jgi:hypothetical protein
MMKRADANTDALTSSKVTAHLVGEQAAKVVFDAPASPGRTGTLVFADGRTMRIAIEQSEPQSQAAVIRFEDGQTAKVTVTETTTTPRLAAISPLDAGRTK